MAAVSKLFGFPSLTLAAVAEAFLIIKLFPDYWGTSSHLAAVGVILCINYAFGVLFWTLLHPRLFSALRNIPGPKALVSPAHKTLVVKGRPSGDLFFDLAAKYPEQELLNLSFLGDQIAVMSPRLMSDLLVGRCYDFVKPPRFSGFLRYVLGDGLILAEGDLHKLLRKHTAPAFHYRQIKLLYSMMWVRAEVLTKTLGKEKAIDNTGAVVIELGNWASKVTLDIIGIAGFGRELNTVEAQVDPLAHTYEELLDPSREKLVFATLCFIFGRETVRWIPNRINKVFDDLTGHLDKLCRPFVQDKKAAMAEKKDGHFDILSLLIKSGAFTDESLKDQLLTFIAAGHETTASALTWACYLLTRRPEMQSKLREEVENALPADNVATMPSEELASALEGLPYLNGIMHETLRLYPTVPLTMRHAIRDTQIDSQFIPKGTDIVIPIWYINRAPEVWGTDASEFRPERWIGENGRPNANGGASSNYDLMTFLHGPRSCTGQGFARAEMRCLLAAMVRAFEWELAMDNKEVMPRGVITIRPENGMYLKLTPRGA